MFEKYWRNKANSLWSDGFKYERKAIERKKEGFLHDYEMYTQSANECYRKALDIEAKHNLI